MKNGLETLPEITSGTDDYVERPSFLETVGASLSYKYTPLNDFIKEVHTYGSPNISEPDEGFIAADNIPDEYKPHASSLLRANNQAHLNFLIGNLERGLNTRKELANSGIGSLFAAEIFDPVNYISLPLKFAGLARTSFSAARQTTAVVGAQELARVPFDAAGTTSETAINIGSAAVMGFAIGGLISLPPARRARAIQKGKEELEEIKKAIEPMEGVEFDPNIAQSAFTNSVLFKAVSTPLKRTIMNPDVPNGTKLTMLGIANDAGILLAGNRVGLALKNSVFQNAKLRDGEWVQVHDEVLSLWGESTGKGVVSVQDNLFKRRDFEDWLTEVDSKAIRGEKPADAYEAKAMDAMNSFYSTWETRLNESGIIGNKGFYLRDIAQRETKIKNLEAEINAIKKGQDKNKTRFNRYKEDIEINKRIIKAHQKTIEGIGTEKINPANEDLFRPRYWDKQKIRDDRSGLAAVLNDWFTNNPNGYKFDPKVGEYVEFQFSTKPAAVSKRVEDAIDSILGLKDVTDVDVTSFGYGKSKHAKHRTLDIPNKLVLDYIHRNPISIMKSYTSRTAARYEFASKFNGQTIDDVIADKMNEMITSGMKLDEANKVSADLRHMYDRVAGTVVREPDAMNQKAANVLRTAAQLGYLGGAGISALTEPAKIMMEHGIGPTMKGLFSVLKDNQLALGAKEARIAGEALEILMGSSHLRLVEDMGNNPLVPNFWDKAKNGFYTLNGLAPITRIFKDFDGMMRSHTLIDYSVRLTQGKASKMETEYLARYGIDADMAKKIANAPHQKSESGMYMANTEAWTDTIEFPATKAEIITGPTNSTVNGRYKPAFYRESENRIYIDEDYVRDQMWRERGWENPRLEGVKPIEKGIINKPDDLVTFVKMHEIMHTIHSSKSLGFDKRTSKGKADYENAINDLTIVEIKSQARVEPETVQSFRNALSSGIANTVLMGTPADKPMITDGIAYIPMRVAKQFGMKEDKKYKGYARIENGLLGLPFQFYSYSLAATNKTLAAYGHGQLKNRFLGTAIALGLGYTVLQMKTPDWVEMSFQDQFARSFDLAGIAPLHSDLIYTAMATSMAVGGPNITGGALQNRFPQEKNYLDAATGLLGAGPSIGLEYARGMGNMLTGNLGDGSKEFIGALPFSNVWIWKDLVNKYARLFGNELDSSFGRY